MQGRVRLARAKKARVICAGRRGGEPSSVEPHTAAERWHQLRIQSAPMREFCAYNKNCSSP